MKEILNKNSVTQKPNIEKESLLESIFNNSNELILISDLDTYTMLYANHPARKFTGHENRPYVGEHCYKYMMGLDEICPFCPIRQMNNINCQETEFDNGQQTFAVKAKIIDFNGKKAFIEYARDITEERKEKLRYEAHMNEQLSIFNALSKDFLNIFLINPSDNTARILKLDGYVTTGLTRSPDKTYPYYDVCKQYISERVHPKDREKMLQAMAPEKILHELSLHSEYVSSYRTLVDDETHYYQFRYMRMEGSTHIIAAFQNIDNIILEEKETQETLSKALEKAEQSNRAKTIFLNSMSHDIRTPLNAIIGCASLAESHLYEPEELQRYLSKICISSNHLLSLVNDVLDMSHIESGKLKFDQEPVHIPDLVDELCMILQTDISSKQLNFQIDTADMTHEDIITDRLRLNQVLLNILGNAVKFTSPGGNILFRIAETADASEDHACYEFHIKDDGIGMKKDFIDHIFETFTREQTSTISGIQGSGLGMPIAHSIVQAMGGSIDVRSESDQGSEFTVHLQFPLCRTPAPQPVSVSNNTIHFDGKKVLLVEDNELNQEIAIEILKNAGFSVDTASDGSIAVEKLKNSVPGQYDMILMDIQMPIMNGYEAARQIRQLPDSQIAGIPILAMTANAFEEDRQKALDAGMNGHISKPIDITKLFATLKEHLQ